MGKFDWLETKHLRSVDQLRLWTDNPRLDPDETHRTIGDFVRDLLEQSGEAEDFKRLISSIATHGYIPADPIVVWQDTENSKFYVAEGNRRILALKLLRSPEKAPIRLRAFVRSKAQGVDRDSIEKVRVAISPSFEEAEWYITTRHSNNHLLRGWTRLQTQRWIALLYDKHDKDIEKVAEITSLTKGELESTIRILKIRDMALNPKVLRLLSEEDRDNVRSHRLPMTILERWFENLMVRERWGIQLSGDKVFIGKDEDSFSAAYANWIRLVLHRDDQDVEVVINTRTITTNLDEILSCLPDVSGEAPVEGGRLSDGDIGDDENEDTGNGDEDAVDDSRSLPLHMNPNRPRIVAPELSLKSSNYRLKAIFDELSRIPTGRYRNCTAAALRVFLDLAIDEHIHCEGWKDDVAAFNKCGYEDVPLKKKIEFVKSNNGSLSKDAKKVLDRLLNYSNDYSLNVLNSYVHGRKTEHTSPIFLNGFWDSIFPLYAEILEMKVRNG